MVVDNSIPKSFRRVASNAAKSSSVSNNVPRGYISVYVGEEQKKRYVVPISYLNESLFQKLLNKIEEEFGYDRRMGGLARTFALILLKNLGI